MHTDKFDEMLQFNNSLVHIVKNIVKKMVESCCYLLESSNYKDYQS